MKQIFGKSAVGFGMLLIGFGAQLGQAQVYDGRGYRGGDRGPNASYALFDQVQADLNRAATFGYLRGGQRRELAKASRDLAEFEGRWSRGRFDRHELDEAIGRIQHVVDHSGLNYRDRSALLDDVGRMRQFRAYESGRYQGYRR
ncbi:MAG: hypothetical protein ACR2I2_17325 [Bryobacteraceae bacterium]